MISHLRQRPRAVAAAATVVLAGTLLLGGATQDRTAGGAARPRLDLSRASSHSSVVSVALSPGRAAGTDPPVRFDLFDGTTWVGSDHTAPFHVAWVGGDGTHHLKGKITMQDGSVHYTDAEVVSGDRVVAGREEGPSPAKHTASATLTVDAAG